MYEYPCFYGGGAHASTVVPRPFLLHRKRPGNEASKYVWPARLQGG